jgi:hypothetical protein
MLITPSLFIAAVNGLIRLGGKAIQAMEDGALHADITVPSAIVDRMRQGTLNTLVLEEILFREELWKPPGAPFNGLFAPDANTIFHENHDTSADARDALLLTASDYVAQTVWGLGPPAGGGRFKISDAPTSSPMVMLTHKAWASKGGVTIWGEIGRELAVFATDVIAAQPDIVGLRGRTGQFVGGLARNLNAIVGPDAYVEQTRAMPFHERAVRVFARAALNTLATEPKLALRDEQWAPVISGFLTPLKEDVAARKLSEGPALDHLNRLLTGPMAHGLLHAISQRADTLLTGKAGANTALGIVSREILTDLVSLDAEAFDVRKLFTEQGAVSVMVSALDVVERQPELFTRGTGASVSAQQTFLRALAKSVKAAPPPYNADSLRPDISGVALETASLYFSQKLVEQSGSSNWSGAAADVGVAIIQTLFDGFRAAASGQAANPFAKLADRNFTVDLLRIVASHVARTPGMVTGGQARPEVASFAKAIAQMIAQDTRGLLHADDWRNLIAEVCTLAAANPGALFAIRADTPPDQQIAVSLTSAFFKHAAARFADDDPRAKGRLLFGETLRDALGATLHAAASVSLRPQDVTASARAMTDFIARLEVLAQSEDRSLRMGAGEWRYVYRQFIAAILTQGDPATISDDQIRAVLLGLEPRVAHPAPEEPNG